MYWLVQSIYYRDSYEICSDSCSFMQTVTNRQLLALHTPTICTLQYLQQVPTIPTAVAGEEGKVGWWQGRYRLVEGYWRLVESCKTAGDYWKSWWVLEQSLVVGNNAPHTRPEQSIWSRSGWKGKRGKSPKGKKAGHQLRHVGYVAAGVKTGGSVESLWVGLIWSEAG